MQTEKNLDIQTIPANPEQLRLAFAAFNEASEQLAGVYQELQNQVVQLTRELALANGELHKQLTAKENLSQQLRLLLNALPGGVIALDAQECIEQINPAAIMILGEPLLGLSWPQVMQMRLIPTAITQEWHIPAQLPANMRRIRIENSVTDSLGRKILLINDITEAYAMQEQVRRNQRLTAMGEMAANLAHQLRTPLSTALIYANHLGNNALTPPERQKFAAKTVERLLHLEQLTKDMLRFVKGETVQLEHVSVRDLFADLQQVLEPQMLQDGLKFIIEDHSGTESLVTDRQALCGALINLLENAMQVSSPGGRITLTNRLESSLLAISIHDDGPGIDLALQERLFEPFFTTRPNGTGLGLAIVRGVIQSLGGNIEINSSPAAGTEFTVRLPRTANDRRSVA
ncbi:MAG: ATP-binding protein [Nitrosomonas sp.]|nr:MAG: ATP-binding protein [Nitrosomonas sp.]